MHSTIHWFPTMKKMSIMLAIASALVILVSACSSNSSVEKQPSAIQVSPSSDPVSQLKSVIEQHKAKVLAGGIFDPGDSLGKRIITSRVTDVSYDVQKTDSLVSPYLGVVTYEVSETLTVRGETTPDNLSCRISYAYQDGKWILKNQEYKDLSISKRWEDISGKSAYSVACGATE